MPTCLRIFFKKVCVHKPWLASCSMISLVSRVLVSAAQLALSRISVANFEPSVVDGHVCFSTTATSPFEPRWCAGLVLVTS